MARKHSRTIACQRRKRAHRDLDFHERFFRMNSRRPALLSALFALFLLLSLVLRLWYSSFALNDGRFYDERFSFDNVRSVLQAGSLEPANGYYPTLAYLPQTLLLAASDRLYRLTGSERWNIYSESGAFGPWAYQISRAVQVLYGTLALLVLFWIGRRVFSPEVGMLAAVLLGCSHWHVHASAYFKPDILLMLTSLLAIQLSLRALARPDFRRYAVAGLGVALAMGSKLTGGLVALPLTLATWMRGWRRGRDWALLVVAGTVSLVVYLVMNPHLRLYLHFMGRLSREYAGSARYLDETRVTMLRDLVQWLGGPQGFAWLGVLIPVGLGLVAWELRREGNTWARRRELFVVLAFPLLFAASYFAATAHFKANNLLPIQPFAALFIAVALARAWAWLGQRWTWLAGGWARAVALTLGGLWLLPQPFLYVYGSLIPTSEDLALQFLSRRVRDEGPRLLFVEAAAAGPLTWEGRRRVRRPMGIRRIERLDSLTPLERSLSDGEVFLMERLEEPGGEAYRQRFERFAPNRKRTIETGPFRIRGLALMAISTPWIAVGAEFLEITRPPGRDSVLLAEAAIPAKGGRESYSLGVVIPSWVIRSGLPLPTLHLDGVEEPLYYVRSLKGSDLLTSNRFLPNEEPRKISLEFSIGLNRDHKVRLATNYWRRGEVTGGNSAPVAPEASAISKSSSPSD